MARGPRRSAEDERRRNKRHKRRTKIKERLQIFARAFMDLERFRSSKPSGRGQICPDSMKVEIRSLQDIHTLKNQMKLFNMKMLRLIPRVEITPDVKNPIRVLYALAREGLPVMNFEFLECRVDKQSKKMMSFVKKIEGLFTFIWLKIAKRRLLFPLRLKLYLRRRYLLNLLGKNDGYLQDIRAKNFEVLRIRG